MSKYYHECKDCGANLDPGERCDCKDARCHICGKKLIWGKFAFRQVECWDCYSKKIAELLDMLPYDEAARYVDAVKVYGSQFGEEFIWTRSEEI